MIPPLVCWEREWWTPTTELWGTPTFSGNSSGFQFFQFLISCWYFFYFSIRASIWWKYLDHNSILPPPFTLIFLFHSAVKKFRLHCQVMLSFLKAHDAEVKDALIFRIVGSVKSWTMVIYRPCTENMNPLDIISWRFDWPKQCNWNDMWRVCYAVDDVPLLSKYELDIIIKTFDIRQSEMKWTRRTGAKKNVNSTKGSKVSSRHKLSHRMLVPLTGQFRIW